MRITWNGAGRERITDLPLEMIERITPDGGELALSAAALVAKHAQADEPTWDMPKGGGVAMIEILDPPAFCGTFAVSLSLSATERSGTGALRLAHPSDPIEEGWMRGPATVGTLARRVQRRTPEQDRQYANAIARMTDPADVWQAYALLGDRHGRGIRDVRAGEEALVGLLEARYRDGGLRDLGCPARSVLDGSLGVLVDFDRHCADEIGREELRAFELEHGIVAQPVTRWSGRDVTMLVAFLPVERIDEAAEIWRALGILGGAPSPAPR